MRRRLPGAAALFLLASACSSSSSAKSAPAEIAETEKPALRIPRTTPPDQAVRALEERITRALERERDGVSTPQRRAGLVGLLMTRAQFLGRPSDYTAALRQADALVAVAPKRASSYLWRSRARAAVHRFADAEADLDRAEALGASASEIEPARAGMLLASGDVAEAFALRLKWLRLDPNITTRGDAALAYAKRGELERASALFDQAVTEHRGVSAFRVAWVLFQHGLMWQRQGELARARHYFELGRQRLPSYAPLVGHLAGVEAARGNRARAIELLRGVVETSTDPEYLGQLGALLGDEELIAQARRGYDTLVAVHASAFADHAAHFWMGPGANPLKAVALARANLEHRVTDEALQLALDATHAAKRPAAEQCALADLALGLTDPTAYLHFATARALRSCGRDHEASAALRRAETAKRQR